MVNTARLAYSGYVSIDFEPDSVTIQTKRLVIRSVRQSDKANYERLFQSDATKTYADGAKKDAAWVANRINTWVKRWQQAHDRFSGFAIHKKGWCRCLRPTFIGHIVLGHGDNPGEAELAYILLPEYQNKHYGSEAGTAIAQYASHLAHRAEKVEDAPLKLVTATCKIDNIASAKICRNIGMIEKKEEEKFGAKRRVFSADPKKLALVEDLYCNNPSTASAIRSS